MAHITLKGASFNTCSHLPGVGSSFPNFELIANDLSVKTLSSFSGKKKIIYTVPSLDTSVCAASSKKFSQEMKQHKDVDVLVISCDLPFAQQRVCGAEGMQNIHSLSLMRSKKLAQDLGVLIVDGPLEGLCARAIFILDEKNKIIHEQLVTEVTHEPDYDKVLSMI